MKDEHDRPARIDRVMRDPMIYNMQQFVSQVVHDMSDLRSRCDTLEAKLNRLQNDIHDQAVLMAAMHRLTNEAKQ